MSLIKGTDFINVSTQDFEKSAQFYGEVLGLEASQRYGKMPGGEFETGNLTLAIIESDKFGVEFQANNHPIALHVDDVAEARAELESRGVEFVHQLDSGVCHMAYFKDPDGNMLCLHNRYAPPGALPPAAV
jgi:catechol 2,3-dioxygenase-like lactoylglutathione lyase family enzyme